jgi:mercuric ion transport protein
LTPQAAIFVSILEISPGRPRFIAATVACLAGGYWLRYRSSRVACADGDVCARALPRPVVNISLILATVLVVGALAFDFLAPLFP